MSKIILDLCGKKYSRTPYTDRKGYPTVCIKGREYKVHILVWEAANGPKPEGYEIHHIDHDKSNYALDNLALLSPSEHRRIHAGWTRENGQWTHKPCNKCGKVLALEDFYYVRTRRIESSMCITCHNKSVTERNSDGRRREYKRDYYRRNYGKGVYLGGEYRPANRWAKGCD